MEKIRINCFVKPIIMKKHKHDFWAWRELRSIMKLNRTCSPDFDTMMCIYEFLNIIKDIYMYNNSKELVICTVTKGWNAAFMYKTNDYSIRFLLRESDRMIAIQMDKLMKGGNTDTSQIKFVEGDSSVIKNIYDEEKFQFIIVSLMTGLNDLIKYYYDNKKL